MKPKANGHLSNERRITQNRRSYAYSIEAGYPQRYDKIAVKKGGKYDTSSPLSHEQGIGKSRPPCVPLLRALASWSFDREKRAYFEWVYCGYKLHVVQYEEFLKKECIEPSAEWSMPAPPAPRNPVALKLRAFCNALDILDTQRWRKTRSPKLFDDCGIKTCPVWLLKPESVIEMENRGDFSAAILEDLSDLLHLPVMIRFDTLASSDAHWENLPRKIVNSIGEAKAHIFQSLSALKKREIPITDIAVVAHQFVPAQAAAWSEGSLVTHEVRVDSIWGMPDGLQSFSHDTFLVNIKFDDRVSKAIRFKEKFFDARPNGDMIEVFCGPPYDWRPSLTDSDVKEIARKTHKIAVEISRSVRIMWFVGVHEWTGLPRCLPWILDDEEHPNSSSISSALAEPLSEIEKIWRIIGVSPARSKVIRNRSDLRRFDEDPDEFDIGRRCLVVKPEPKIVRDILFVKQLAKAVKKYHGYTVLWEGSPLAHACSILRRENVRVVTREVDRHTSSGQSIGKLVRDAIPDKIEQGGEQTTIVKLRRHEHLAALREKLIEESLEVHAAEDQADLREEIADVLSVLQDLAKFSEIEWDAVEKTKAEKTKRRGGFKEGIFLVSTHDRPDSGAGKMRQELQIRSSKDGERIKLSRDRAGFSASLIPPASGSQSSLLELSSPQGTVKLRVSYKDNFILVEIEPEPVQLRLPTK